MIARKVDTGMQTVRFRR